MGKPWGIVRRGTFLHLSNLNFCEEADHLVGPLHFAQDKRNAEVEKRKKMNDERIKIWPVLMFQLEKYLRNLLFARCKMSFAGDVKGSEITADNDNWWKKRW